MDIKREPPKKTKKIIAYGAGLVAIVAVSIGISRLKPAAPPVERGTLWIDTVKRGMMTRDVNAPGTLEPEYVRNITALTSGRVEELPVRPGINVTTNTLLVVMSSPDEQIKELQYEQSLNQAIGNLANLKTTLHQQILSQQSNLASTRTSYNDAVRQAAVQDSLAKKKLSSDNDVAAAHDKINEYRQRMDIEQKRLEDMQRSEQEQIQLNEQQIEGLRRILADQRRRVASMRVTSPENGQLQMLGNPPLELGQYVNAGALLARVVQPGKLKAVLRVPETQAVDIVPGLPATIDLHNNNVVKGHVMRTDPSSVVGTVTVEVSIEDTLPAGTRSDVAVDGTIQIERLNDVLYVARPGFGQPNSSVGIFKVLPNKGEAVRVTVQLGKASVNTIEVRGGLQIGDSVIVSDMTPFDNTNRVRIK
ncbi:MAG TPA: HlyD family efflux transporter periplasmic adaptor subunit [Gemmatimonadaceae bacterium]|nr:HlyD family efflux transporter periplasmic adaptor subunit [Gemmatimonadaceae bacterium]